MSRIRTKATNFDKLAKMLLCISNLQVKLLWNKVEAEPHGSKPMIMVKRFLSRLNLYSVRRRIENALALHRRDGLRRDGLTLIQASHRLAIEWRAREIHPWDRGCEQLDQDDQFTEQSFADTDAALSRLFDELPEIDVIEFRVIHPASDERILDGIVERSALTPVISDASPRTRLWRKGVTIKLLAAAAIVSTKLLCA